MSSPHHIGSSAVEWSDVCEDVRGRGVGGQQRDSKRHNIRVDFDGRVARGDKNARTTRDNVDSCVLSSNPYLQKHCAILVRRAQDELKVPGHNFFLHIQLNSDFLQWIEKLKANIFLF